MNKIDAQKYPLVSEVNLSKRIGKFAGEAVLLLPNGTTYNSQEYGLGELKVLAALQGAFSSDKETRLADLSRRLNRSDPIIYDYPMNNRESWFLQSVLSRLERNGLVNMYGVRKTNRRINPDARIAEGTRYSGTRLKEMNARPQTHPAMIAMAGDEDYDRRMMARDYGVGGLI